MMTVIETQVAVINKLGLHARAAAKLVNLASQYESSIWLSKDGHVANVKSIMTLLMLAAAKGSMLTLRCEGEDAESATQGIADLFQDKFGEDE